MRAPAGQLATELHRLAERIGREARFMEVCGTHTVSMFRHGLRSLLPRNVQLISGPGCPVCVTAQRHIDAAIALSQVSHVILATYGDMIRVPGRLGSLEASRARGADVRAVNSTLTALKLARDHPLREVVFVAVGFETTAPATAAALKRASQEGVRNFSVLVAHKLVVPAMLALLASGDDRLDGFLCPGHVSVIIGAEAYRPVVERHRRPCVVAGFEPEGMMAGLLALLRQTAAGEARLENVYPQVVSADGNRAALKLLDEVFTVADEPWRELGVIAKSGLKLRPAYERFDALTRFGIELGEDEDHPACRCGEVIQGRIHPKECRVFGTACTPLSPLGPCMVSSEGTCSAWYKYGRAMAVGKSA